MKRKICFFTGTRAEYGLLRPLIALLYTDPDFTVQIVVSAMHMSKKYGLTYRDIESDGYTIDAKIRTLDESNTPLAVAESISVGVKKYSKEFARLKPEYIVVLGDRYESFAAAVAATVLCLPLVHIHGGESTFGLIDEPMRHAITKMSHVHFTSTEVYRKRVIQLGEHPRSVYNVGALGIDSIKQLTLLSKNEIEQRLGFTFQKKNILCTFHPVTLEHKTAKKQFAALLSAFDAFPDVQVIFTKANADADGMVINAMIDAYVKKHSSRAICYTSMGQLNYLSAMHYVDGVVGNSSSGVIEAPSCKVATINIGDRQKGRIKAQSVIDCDPEKVAIVKAIKLMYSKRFAIAVAKTRNPYGSGNAAKKIKKVLKEKKIPDLKKVFYDI